MSLFKRSGGGFLNGVDAVIASYKFDTKEFESKKTGNPYNKLSVELGVTIDGADEPVTTYLDAGFFYPDNQSISEDGLSLEADSDSPIIQEDTEFARFIGSLIQNGFPEANFQADGRNFEAMVGSRVRLIKKVDEEATKKLGKRKDKKDPTKEYNRDVLLVDAVLGLPDGKAKKAAPKAANKTTAAANKATAKSAKAEVDTDATDKHLVAIIATYGTDGTLGVDKLSASVVRYALKAKLAAGEREALRNAVTDKAYLAGADERGVIGYDADANTVTVA